VPTAQVRVLFLCACWWDARLEARQDRLTSATADRQDRLSRDLANQAEVLENTRFVRSIATSKEETPKPFASINLRGAELGGLELGCNPRTPLGCADFRKADLQEANLTTAGFAGAGFWEADLRKANLTGTDLSSAFLKMQILTAPLRCSLRASKMLYWSAQHSSKPDLRGLTSVTPCSVM
jgi:uncharacterized protein YjbI with pentapeptide repeats